MLSMAYQLEDRRQAGGDTPLRLTSFYRTPADNAAAGGVDHSDHERGEAVDYVPQGVDVAQWARAVIASRAVGASGGWGQFIVYAYTDGHIHESLPGAGGHLGEIYVVTNSPPVYRAWNGVDPLPAWEGAADGTSGAVSPVLLGLLLVAALVVLYEFWPHLGG